MQNQGVKLKVGIRILYHIQREPNIREGIILEISPSGKLFRIEGKWYCEELSLSDDGPAKVEILDILDEKPRE